MWNFTWRVSDCEEVVEGYKFTLQLVNTSKRIADDW
ncbi:uncharacterized protein METZ01_LOCUS454893, partial [marine metagenome]